jgi:hypothetical protein
MTMCNIAITYSERSWRNPELNVKLRSAGVPDGVLPAAGRRGRAPETRERHVRNAKSNALRPSANLPQIAIYIELSNCNLANII